MRNQNDISVKIYGIDCQLYIASNASVAEDNDAYLAPDQYTYAPPMATQVFVEWRPNMYRLRAMGLFVEGALPILAHFTFDRLIPIGSYFTVAMIYVPAVIDTQAFNIENLVVPDGSISDIEVKRYYSVAPRRNR